MESLSLLMNSYLSERLLLATEACQCKSGHLKTGEGPIPAFPIPQEEDDPSENQDDNAVLKFLCEGPAHDEHVQVADKRKNGR